MYYAADSAPAPLDFNTPRDTDSVADTLGPDTRPHDPFFVSDLHVGALLAEIALSAQAIREIRARSSAPGL